MGIDLVTEMMMVAAISYRQSLNRNIIVLMHFVLNSKLITTDVPILLQMGGKVERSSWRSRNGLYI